MEMLYQNTGEKEICKLCIIKAKIIYPFPSGNLFSKSVLVFLWKRLKQKLPDKTFSILPVIFKICIIVNILVFFVVHVFFWGGFFFFFCIKGFVSICYFNKETFKQRSELFLVLSILIDTNRGVH